MLPALPRTLHRCSPHTILARHIVHTFRCYLPIRRPQPNHVAGANGCSRLCRRTRLDSLNTCSGLGRYSISAHSSLTSSVRPAPIASFPVFLIRDFSTTYFAFYGSNRLARPMWSVWFCAVTYLIRPAVLAWIGFGIAAAPDTAENGRTIRLHANRRFAGRFARWSVNRFIHWNHRSFPAPVGEPERSALPHVGALPSFGVGFRCSRSRCRRARYALPSRVQLERDVAHDSSRGSGHAQNHPMQRKRLRVLLVLHSYPLLTAILLVTFYSFDQPLR